MSEFCVILYLFIGVLVIVYDWKKNYEVNYNIAKQYGETEDSMVCLYFLFGIILWPLILMKQK